MIHCEANSMMCSDKTFPLNHGCVPEDSTARSPDAAQSNPWKVVTVVRAPNNSLLVCLVTSIHTYS